MSFYGSESDIVRKRFTPSLTTNEPNEPRIPIEKEKKLASEKRELLDLKTQVNSVKVVDSTENSGFYCSACKITLKDSSSYLDHVNSRAHARNLGLEMRVEKATVAQVEARIEFHKARLKSPKKDATEIIQEKRKLQANLELQRKNDKKSRKLARKDTTPQDPVQDPVQNDLLSSLGFSNFNSSKKS